MADEFVTSHIASCSEEVRVYLRRDTTGTSGDGTGEGGSAW